MKPSKLIWLGILCSLLGSCLLYTFYANMGWYVKNIPVTFVMGLLITIALLMSLGGAVLFAYGLQELFEK